jgi:hypothetical protein
MGFVIGNHESGQGYTTWAKLRTPLIGAYDDFKTYAGAGLGPHNYEIFSGFHPEEGLFVRTARWPGVSFWVDINSDPHNEYDGPIVGYQNGGGVSPYNSFFSVGAYDWSGNGTTNPVYTSANNLLDKDDIADSLVGLTVTYSGGTFTTTSDAFKNDPASSPWFGQDIGLNAITSVTSISTFTAF